MNYRKVEFISENKYISIDNDSLYINYNNTYYYLLYLSNNKVELLLYINNVINNTYILNVIKNINKNNIYIYGKNKDFIIKKLEKYNINYYHFEKSDNLIINKIINE